MKKSKINDFKKLIVENISKIEMGRIETPTNHLIINAYDILRITGTKK
jgi:hypothetical protein